MSNAALNAVWQHSQSKGSARLVLLAMADEASEDGELSAYRRSRSHLARKANVDERTVPRVIGQLVELGEVIVLAVGDGRQKSDYRILLPGLGPDDDRTPDHPRGGSTPPPPGGSTPPQGWQHATPITPVCPV